MEEKKYLKWYNKVGYGSGDIAGNRRYIDCSFKTIGWRDGCIFRNND